jgi:hypothetical protein
MTRDTACGAPARGWVAALLVLAAWAGVVTAKEPAASVTEEPPPEAADKREPNLARWPTYSVTLRNPYKEKIYIRSLAVEVSDARVDKRPQPLYDLMPFLDVMAVKANNLGWGSADPGSLQVCVKGTVLEGGPEGKAAARRAKKLDLLLGLPPNTLDLPAPSESGFSFARIDPKAEPFRFVCAGRVDVTGSRPLPHQMEDGKLVTSSTETVLATEAAGRGRLAANYSDSGYFQGEFTKKGEKAGKKIPFLARRLQKLELTEEGAFVNKLLRADLEGGLYKEWVVEFGNSASVVREVAGTGIIFGATIDLGDGMKTKITVPAVLEIEAGEEQTFSLTFVSSKSLHCTVQGHLEYKFGNAPSTATFRFIKPRAIETKVPRAPDLGWAESKAFLRDLRKIDPGVADRARKALEAGLPGKDRKATTVAGAASQARKFAQALWMLSEEVPDDRAVKDAARDFVRWAGDLPPYDENRDVVSEYFPLLCRTSPPDAVRIALAWAKGQRQDDALIARGLCVPGFLKEVESHAEDQRRALTGPKKEDEFWPPSMIAFAALVHDPRVPALFKGENSQDAGNWAVLAWADSKQPSAGVDALLRDQLKDKMIPPETAKGIIDALRLTKNERFWDDVHAYARWVSKTNARSHVEALLATLHYFQGFNRASLKPLLEELERSPLGSDVQAAARKLLGKSG